MKTTLRRAVFLLVIGAAVIAVGLQVAEAGVRSGAVAFTVGVLLTGCVVFWFERRRSQRLAAQIQELTTTVERLAQGDITARTKVTHDADEAGMLGTAINAMAQSLQRKLQEEREANELIKGKVDLILEVVAKAADGDLTGEMMLFNGTDNIDLVAKGIQRMLDGLNSLVSQVQQSGIHVTSSATEIAATAMQQEATVTEQAATTHQIKATVSEIAATSRELFKTVQDVTQVAWQTSESATQGQSSLQRMETTMHQMMEGTTAIGAKLAVLNEKASNIGSVVTTINKVADQTNLLSLNAAIEAEKAGEYGRGFAVVATEVRRLADQTAVATWDIEQMVKEMQSAVAAGVMGMDKFSDEVRRGVEDVREVSAKLARIIEQVQALMPEFASVNEGMQSQAKGAEQITEAMLQLSETAQQTAESLRQSSSAIQQLNHAAAGLQQGVSRFRVS